jgi:hypothetical protein
MQDDDPVLSKDGKKIFSVGIQSSAELSFYDSRLHDFVPYLGGIPQRSVSFSRDGQWVAYVRRGLPVAITLLPPRSNPGFQDLQRYMNFPVWPPLPVSGRFDDEL